MTRRWFPLLALAVTAYLAWRLALVIQTPTLAAAVLLTVEVLAWLGFGAFLFRVSPPSRTSRRAARGRRGPGRHRRGARRRPAACRPRAQHPVARLRHAAQVLLVDDGRREPAGRVAVDDLVTTAHGSVVVRKRTAWPRPSSRSTRTLTTMPSSSWSRPDRCSLSTAIDALSSPCATRQSARCKAPSAGPTARPCTRMPRAVRAWASSYAREAPAAGDAGVVADHRQRFRAAGPRVARCRSRHRATSALPSMRTDGRRGSRPRPPCIAVRRHRRSNGAPLRTNKLASERHRAWGALFARNLRPTRPLAHRRRRRRHRVGVRARRCTRVGRLRVALRNRARPRLTRRHDRRQRRALGVRRAGDPDHRVARPQVRGPRPPGLAPPRRRCARRVRARTVCA